MGFLSQPKKIKNKVSIKHPNICIVPKKKEEVCVFPFLGKNSLEMKKRQQNAIERTLPYSKLKVIFKSPSKIVNHFHFKDVFPNKLCSANVYSFKSNSCNAIYYDIWQFRIWQTNLLKMLGNQLFQITCLLVTIT